MTASQWWLHNNPDAGPQGSWVTRAGRGLGSHLKRAGKRLMNSLDRGQNEFRDVDPHGNLAGQAWQASNFADLGQTGFQQTGERMGGLADMMERLARGEDSFSAEQLRGSLQQNLANQQSFAAGAAPTNQAMAARTAAIQGGQMGAGLAGQQALAGIAERQAAQQGLAGLLGNMRQQDLQAALQSRQNALSGFGGIEQERGRRFDAISGTPTSGERILGMATDVASLLPWKKKKKEQ